LNATQKLNTIPCTLTIALNSAYFRYV